LTVVEINRGYATLIAQFPEVASLLTNPRLPSSSTMVGAGITSIRTVISTIVSNTTWYFRASLTSLPPPSFSPGEDHLNPGGIFFYNTTDSAPLSALAV
jgi:hypothetical protein